jgi:hypothetical protein
MILPRSAAASVQGNVVYGGSLITLLPIKGKIPGDRSADLRLPGRGSRPARTRTAWLGGGQPLDL